MMNNKYYKYQQLSKKYFGITIKQANDPDFDPKNNCYLQIKKYPIQNDPFWQHLDKNNIQMALNDLNNPLLKSNISKAIDENDQQYIEFIKLNKPKGKSKKTNTFDITTIHLEDHVRQCLGSQNDITLGQYRKYINHYIGKNSLQNGNMIILDQFLQTLLELDQEDIDLFALHKIVSKTK